MELPRGQLEVLQPPARGQPRPLVPSPCQHNSRQSFQLRRNREFSLWPSWHVSANLGLQHAPAFAAAAVRSVDFGGAMQDTTPDRAASPVGLHASRSTSARRAVVRKLGAAGLALAAAFVGGGGSAGAKNCGYCEKPKRGRCKSNPARNGIVCGRDRVCANGRCVTFDGSCPANANPQCAVTDARCGPRDGDCTCYQRVSGGVVCADSISCLNGAPCTATSGCPSTKPCIETSASCGCLSGTACAERCPEL